MSPAAPPKDLLFRDAKIRTLDPAAPRAEALAVRDGRVVAAGSLADVRGSVGPRAEVVSLGGRDVTPGFADAHTHLDLWARARARLSLAGAETPAEVTTRVRARHAALPEGAWLWGEELLPYSAWQPAPDRVELDQAAPGRPVVLWTRDRHGGWASSAALARAGVDPRASDPPGGALGRREGGELDGWLFESARLLVTGAAGANAAEDAPLAPVLAELAACGVTCVHDFGGRASWDAHAAARAAGRLTVRVAFGFFCGGLAGPADLGAVARDVRDAQVTADDRLWPFGLKAFADGSLGAHTAHLLAPYEGGSDRGLATLSAAELDGLGALARELGVSLAVHAIGDAAVRACLDAFARWSPADRAALRPRIEHAQLVAAGDFARFAELGVIASMQPLHAVDDRAMAERLWGARDALGGYAWSELARAGARLALGSDAPIASADPRRGVHAALIGGDPSEHARGRTPARALDVESAVLGFTAGPAYAVGREATLGRLAPGAGADFVVWERDPFAARAEDWPALSVLETWVGGERAHPSATV